MENTFKIPEICTYCHNYFAKNCEYCKAVQKQASSERERGITIIKEENKDMIPQTYDYQEGN